MKLATIDDGSRDGRLVVVSTDGMRCAQPPGVATLQAALDDWASAEPELRSLSTDVDADAGESTSGVGFSAPLPRAWQWLDGSAFDSHGDLMQTAFRLDPIETDAPLMYQGMSHLFYGPTEDVPFVSEADGIDFEGEFGAIVDDVAMGTGADGAMERIKLLVQLDDWSLRVLGPKEMKTGFGWVQAKPACSMAPFAVTPDEIGEARRGALQALSLRLSGVVARPPGSSGMKSAFLSDVFHALRAGRDFVMPVSPGATSWVISLDRAVDNFVHALELDFRSVGHGHAVTLPTLRVVMADVVAEIARQSGASSERVSYEPRQVIEAGFGLPFVAIMMGRGALVAASLLYFLKERAAGDKISAV